MDSQRARGVRVEIRRFPTAREWVRRWMKVSSSGLEIIGGWENRASVPLGKEDWAEGGWKGSFTSDGATPKRGALDSTRFEDTPSEMNRDLHTVCTLQTSANLQVGVAGIMSGAASTVRVLES